MERSVVIMTFLILRELCLVGRKCLVMRDYVDLGFKWFKNIFFFKLSNVGISIYYYCFFVYIKCCIVNLKSNK